jgi:hypothetical protein
MAVLGWYPDPSGRHEQRFFDGVRWTDHVSDGDTVGVDPAAPASPTVVQPVIVHQPEPIALVHSPSVARRAASRYGGWPLWAKIAAPVAALGLIGGVATAGGEDNGDDTPRQVVDVIATTVPATTTTVVVEATAPPTTAAPVVATTAAPPPTATPTTRAPLVTSPPTTTAPSVYYANCAAARADGAAPVHRGDPGYGSHLDRDGDGIGCE